MSKYYIQNLNKKINNLFSPNGNNIITTPYEKVLNIINEAKKFINNVSSRQVKLIRNLEWVIKIITSHSLYTYELNENEVIDKYIKENPDYKQFVDFVYEYNEEVIQMNKKTNIINSKSKKISNDITSLLNESSLKLKRNLIEKKIFKKNNNIIKKQKSFSNQKYSYDDKINNSKNNSNNKINNNNNNKINSIKQLNINKFHINSPNLYKSVNLNTEGNYIANKISLKSNNNNSSTQNKLISHNKTNSYTYTSSKNSSIKPKLSFYINNKTNNNNNTNNSSNDETFISHKYSIKTYKTKDSSDKIFMNIETILSKSNFDPKSILEKDFNIFELKKLIGHENVLPLMGKTILDAFGLINDKIISTKKLNAFLISVSNQYFISTLYHNSMHGADITQTISLFFLNSNAEQVCDTNVLDLLSIIIAALGHDIGHPGLTNGFQINASSDMALTYNDISCLENFHASKLFRTIKKDETNIFENLNCNEYKTIRKRMISEILATDMANHGKVMSVIKARIPKDFDNVNQNFELLSGNEKSKSEEQQALLDFFIHAADLAHNTKLFKISIQWVELLSNEFWNQGDKEKNMKLPVSFLCDRNDTNVPKSQVGFISGFILPTFEVLVTMFPTLSYTTENAKINISEWQKRVEENRLKGWTPPNEKNNNNDDNNISNNNNNNIKENGYSPIKENGLSKSNSNNNNKKNNNKISHFNIIDLQNKTNNWNPKFINIKKDKKK